MTLRVHASLILLLANTAFAGAPAVKTGIDVLRDRDFDILRGKRVGLITNPTGVDAGLRSTIDILFHATGVKLVALFGPEHGVRGDAPAGSTVASTTDPQTGLPVYSLYGQSRKPTPQMLKGIDVLVYDMQDAGCRAFTFVSTMGLAMQAAAEQGIEFVVLDRPNPLGGLRVEGAVVEPAFISFVGQFAIPYVYGLTCGELARLLNDEGLLPGRTRCQLTVVSMRGWKRDMVYRDTGLLWVPPSPHMPDPETPLYSIASGALGELGTISVGVGYTLPFRLFAASWIDPVKVAEGMNALGLRGVLFRPVSFRPFYGDKTGTLLGGVQFYLTQPDSVGLLGLQFLFLQVLHQMYPHKDLFALATPSRIKAFDQVLGTDKIRKAFARRMRYDDIREMLSGDAERFKQRSKKYYLY